MSETDRELLELAAKAVGHAVTWEKMDGGWADGIEVLRLKDGTRFDPLNDDGDAFRLARDLGMDVYFDEVGNGAVVLAYQMSSHDPEARRAIVRAAAEIGRRMA
jgi:hypothetical protein